LLEVECEWASNVVERTIGLANSSEVDVRHAIGKLELAISCETIEDKRQTLVTFNVAGTLEELVQDSSDQILCGRDKTRHRDLVG